MDLRAPYCTVPVVACWLAGAGGTVLSALCRTVLNKTEAVSGWTRSGAGAAAEGSDAVQFPGSTDSRQNSCKTVQLQGSTAARQYMAVDSSTRTCMAP